MSRTDCGASMPGDGQPWLIVPFCTKPPGHRGYHSCIFEGVKYDWPPSSEAAVGADKPGS